MNGKLKIWLSMLVLVPIVAGVYGILHDQITYSISSEYFTHFKFIQFRIDEELRDFERLAAALVGFLATWWVGIPLAVLLGLIGFRKQELDDYRKLRVKSVKTVFLVAVIFGFIGYFFGLYQASQMADFAMNIGGRGFANIEMASAMTEIRNWDNFMVVGTIHNFSYIGALVGLIITLIQQFRVVKRIAR